MARREELSDEQWKINEPLLGEMPRRSDGRGRPWRDNREVINGILWILRTGAPWADLPTDFRRTKLAIDVSSFGPKTERCVGFWKL